MKKKNKLYVTLKIIKRRVKLRTLLLLALTLTANSYAWFIYTTKVNNVIEARVRSWNVRFDLEQSEVAEYIDFVVSDMYPGMPDFEREIRKQKDGNGFYLLDDEDNILYSWYIKWMQKEPPMIDGHYRLKITESLSI